MARPTFLLPKVSALAAAAVALMLAACANPRAEQASYARTALVGMPEAQLVSCAGVPDRTRTVDGREYFTYESEVIDARYGYGYGPTVSVFGGNYYNHTGLGYGFGVPLATAVQSDYCEATFILDEGYVAQLNYLTPTGYGGRGISQCYNIVQNCLGAVPPMPVQ